MTRQEFLNQFDVYYNNSTSNQAPNLNGYEKSVFLTRAEYEVLKNYFNAKGNRLSDGFDDTPKRQIDFSTIIKKKTFTLTDATQAVKLDSSLDDILFILSEEVIEDGKSCIVVPISYEEYRRHKSKPYPYPLKNQVWRIIEGDINSSILSLYGHYGKTITSYSIRYVKNPTPIVVDDNDVWPQDATAIDLTVMGWPKISEEVSEESTEEENTATVLEFPPIEVPEELHDEILQRAVELAKIAWQGDLNSTLAGGQRSE